MATQLLPLSCDGLNSLTKEPQVNRRGDNIPANVGKDVVSRRRRVGGISHPSGERAAGAKGSGGNSDFLKPAPRGRVWIWVGGLDRSTVSDNVLNHLKSSFSNDDLLVYDLKSKSKKKSFKVGSRDLSEDELLDPKLWPDGVVVRPFRSIPNSQQQ